MTEISDTIEKIELDIPHRDGSQYNEYKGTLYLLTRCPASGFVNEKEPIKHKLFEILNIFYWNGIPEEFLEPLVFHELREAEEMYDEGLSEEEAHEIAKKEHMEYIKKFLDKDIYKRFVEWQNQFPKYQNGV